MLYQKNNIDILVFKTNVFSEDDLMKIAELLGGEPNIFKWSIDTEDIDHVLRIESKDLSVQEVIFKVEAAGFLCNELTD